MIDLSESKSYQRRMAQADAEGMAKGLARAEAQVRAEARSTILRETILRLGQKKFGKPSAKAVRSLKAIADEARLMALSDRILDVDSWKELFAPAS